MNAIKKISPRGATNLFGGLERAYDILSGSIKDNDISHSRIFLFSDGLLNAGITDTKTILNTVSKWKNELDISISSFGIGYDFDRELMTSIAESARGDFFFIDSPESISKIIEIGRKGAASLIGKNAVLRVKTSKQVRITNMFDRGDIDHATDGSIEWDEADIDIRDLRAGDSKYAVIEFDVNPSKNMEDENKITVVEWKLRYDDILSKEKKQISGKIDIEAIGGDDERLMEETNVDGTVKVFWDLNKIRMMDKEILDDIENENYDEAIDKRQGLFSVLNKFKQSNSWNKMKEGEDSSMKLTSMRMMERMEDDVVKNKIEKIKKKRARKEKISSQEKDEILMDYGARYMYSASASSDHNEL